MKSRIGKILESSVLYKGKLRTEIKYGKDEVESYTITKLDGNLEAGLSIDIQLEFKEGTVRYFGRDTFQVKADFRVSAEDLDMVVSDIISGHYPRALGISDEHLSQLVDLSLSYKNGSIVE